MLAPKISDVARARLTLKRRFPFIIAIAGGPPQRYCALWDGALPRDRDDKELECPLHSAAVAAHRAGRILRWPRVQLLRLSPRPMARLHPRKVTGPCAPPMPSPCPYPAASPNEDQPLRFQCRPK